MSSRDCSYATQVPPKSLPAPIQPPHGEIPTPFVARIQERGILPTAKAASTILASSPLIEEQTDSPRQCPDDVINFNHLELLVHLTTDQDIFSLGFTEKEDNKSVNEDKRSADIVFAIDTGLQSSYLMYQLLAFAARHLATIHPGRAASYNHQAVALQTQAISIFNSIWVDDAQPDHVAVLLFSSILGHHLPADALARRPNSDLDAFLTDYVQCIEMHRGIYTSATSAWPQLMESRLGPMLAWSSSFTSQTPWGTNCQKLVSLIDGTETLDKEEKEVCLTRITYLQVGFDSARSQGQETREREQIPEHGNRHYMIYTWPMLTPPRFTKMLATKRPEALCILAYYAVLLHYGRYLWQVGDAGINVLSDIRDYLGPAWDSWLEYPEQQIKLDLMRKT